MSQQFVIGIDLGTTNCALACAQLSSSGTLDPHALLGVEAFPVPQLAAPSDVREMDLLASSLFLTASADFPQGSTDLPWDRSDEAHPNWVVGELARKRGAEIPSRLVSSAKSWLSQSGIDRTAAILPPEAVSNTGSGAGEQVSPVEASRYFLDHLRRAWNHTHSDAPFEQQHILVTVPASFDAVARDLTLRAAREAGYPELVLLEEPQAAFYAWLEHHTDWRTRIAKGDLVLVVDVGGGTTDFSLIAIGESAGDLSLDRVAVGEHILLGGDNIDLALAHTLKEKLGRKLSAAQFNALWQNARRAKEKLSSDSALAEISVTIPGLGSSLIGGSLQTALERTVLNQIALEGFFPAVTSNELPERGTAVGLAEEGLQYAADPAITRHLAAFLRQTASAQSAAVRRSPSGLAAPTHVLFNGGVFQSPALRERLLGVLNQWLAAEGIAAAQELPGEDLMQGVARGAAYYGLVRLAGGVRIRGGIARTYYIGMQPALPAVPGIKPPLKALTVAPYGMEEGTKLSVSNRPFRLRVGEPASFRFFASAQRKDDPAGTVLDDIDESLEELAPIEVTLPASGEAQTIPVMVETEITETGQLQLWCLATDGRRWKLEFNRG